VLFILERQKATPIFLHKSALPPDATFPYEIPKCQKSRAFLKNMNASHFFEENSQNVRTIETSCKVSIRKKHMKKFNKVLAIALVMALCVSSELGAIKFKDLAEGALPTGVQWYPGDGKHVQGQRYCAFWRGCDPLGYDVFKVEPDGSWVVLQRLELAPESEQLASYQDKKAAHDAWAQKLQTLKDQAHELGIDDSFSSHGKKTSEIENTNHLESLLPWAVAHKLGRKDLRTMATANIQKSLFGTTEWDFAKAKKLVKTANEIAKYQRLAQNVTDLEQAIAAHKKTDTAASTYAEKLERLTANLKAETQALEAQRTAMGLKAGCDLDKATTLYNAKARGRLAKEYYAAYRKAAKDLAEATQQLKQQEQELAQITEKLNPASRADSSASSGASMSAEQRRDLEQKRSDLARTTAELKASTEALQQTVEELAEKLNIDPATSVTPVKGGKLAFDVALTQQAAKLREKAKAVRAFKDTADRAEAIRFAEAELARLEEVKRDLEAQKPSEALTKKIAEVEAKTQSLTEALDAVTSAASVSVSTESDSSAAPATDKFAKLDALVEAEALRLEAQATKYEDAVKQAKAAADAKASWSWKQIVGFNVATIVLANMFENMLEGWVGSNIKGKDKRTTKQKAIDMAKALISIEMYKANFVQLGRVFVPAKPAEGKTTPSFGKRAVTFAKHKPFIAAGAGVWVAGNVYMAATGLTAKNFKAKYFPVKAA